MKRTLMVIIPDRLSDLLKKGEIIDRYYNPGAYFNDVHLVMTNEDKPDVQKLQRMVGDAQLTLHNFEPPPHFFRNTFGWQRPLIQNWVSEGVELAKQISPRMVRTHNNFLEGYLAANIKKVLKIPYVVSLHGVWDEDDLGTWKHKVQRFFRRKLEIEALSTADAVLCVYSPILRYAKSHGAPDPQLVYNFVSNKHIIPKTDYQIQTRPKLITVNRQLPEKDPTRILQAIESLDVEYTLIGDGPLHNTLVQLAKDLNILHKVRFIKSLPNERVCELMHQSDLMVSNCHYKGISKTLIEGGLTGLPIIINRYPDLDLPEYAGEWVKLCEDTAESYYESIAELCENASLREKLGQKAKHETHLRFSPEKMEHAVVNIYKELCGD